MTDLQVMQDVAVREQDTERRDAIELFLQLCDLEEEDLLEAVERLDPSPQQF